MNAVELYMLRHWTIRRNAKRGTAIVHLHGEVMRWLSRPQKIVDYVELPMYPGESDADLVRCAVAVVATQHPWKVDSDVNKKQFDKQFDKPLSSQMLETVHMAQRTGGTTVAVQSIFLPKRR